MRNDDPLTVTAVGDVMTGCGYFSSLVGDSIPHALTDPERSLLADDVAETLAGSDLTLGNLECVVSEEFGRDGDGIPERLMGPAESVPMLRDAGFDVVNLANNHILDHGSEYVLETMALLENHGIDHVGNPLAERDSVTYTLKGHEISIDGYCLPDFGDEAEKDRIRSTLTEGDDRFDIVSIHWGLAHTEHMRQPCPEQVSFARELIDCGADVILGHHSHTFQPVERYNGGVIAHSLGNFLFDMWRERNKKSGILKLVVDDGIDASIVPIEQVDYQVRFDDAEFIRGVQDTPVEWQSEEPYRAVSDRVRRRHKLDVIGQFLANFHRFPPSYHLSTYSRWVRKAVRELKRSVGGARR